MLMMLLGLTAIAVANGTPTLWATGAVLLVISHFIRIIAAGYIEKNEILVTAGPFSCTRNPLYIGNFIAAVAMLFMCGRWEMIIPVIGGWFLTHLPAVSSEEQFLRDKFGERFDEYCRRVPRWMPQWPRGGEGRRFSLRRVLENKEHLHVMAGWLIAAVFYIETVK
ncbi:MAG: isoprenylcysteine carboxylmethyltransferase family protein [Armatimonadetes bacterium]|nr:isoprenylcysteine carboxylmethyltransferase family protein [Armatimonadota bacterium]